MKKRTARIAAVLLALSLFGTGFTTYADEQIEATEEAPAEDANAEGENPEETDGEEVSEEAQGSGEVVMSGITASNGREIAKSFPDSYTPEGFHKTTVEYSGDSVEVAYMDSDGYGEVVLAYLANSDGSDGDFYLCDINTAEMTDYVRINNGEGKFIVVLNPGDNVVAPSGFVKATLNWHSKTVTAWALPSDKDEDDSKKDKDEASVVDCFKPMEVYALDITAGADSSDSDSEDEDVKEDSSEEEEKEEKKEDKKKDKKEKAEKEPEDGSRVEYADSKDFFLIYAIDQDGVVGFYLYDIVGETFQRYVEIAAGDSALLKQYRNDAKLRLIIMVVLAVLLLVCIIIIINLLMNSGGGNRRSRYDYDDDDDDEDDDDEEEDDERSRMIRRVAKKEKSHIKQGRRELNYMMDIDDDDDEDDDDEEDDIEEYKPVRRRRNEPVRRPERVRKPVIDDDDEDDDDDMDFEPIKRVKRTPAKPAAPKKGISIEPDIDDDLDEDFDFEFLDL